MTVNSQTPPGLTRPASSITHPLIPISLPTSRLRGFARDIFIFWAVDRRRRRRLTESPRTNAPERAIVKRSHQVRADEGPVCNEEPSWESVPVVADASSWFPKVAPPRMVLGRGTFSIPR